MTIAFLKGWLDKMFWPLVILYIAYVLFKVYSYYTGKSLAVNQDIYQSFYTKTWVITGILVGVALVLKVWGKTRFATLLLAVPAGISLLVLFLSLLAWVFLAVVFAIFGK